MLHNNAGIHEAMISRRLHVRVDAGRCLRPRAAVNLRGSFLCRRRLPYLKASTRGPSIVNAGSTASFVGYPFGLAYGTSKGAITLLTKNLAVSLARVRRSGSTATARRRWTRGWFANVSASIGAHDAASRHDGGALSRAAAGNDAHLDAHLVRRIGDPSDIAELVCFLSSDAASFVNGAVWLIDGGVLAWRDTVESLGLGSP